MRGQLDRNAANKSELLSIQRHLEKICQFDVIHLFFPSEVIFGL